MYSEYPFQSETKNRSEKDSLQQHGSQYGVFRESTTTAAEEMQKKFGAFSGAQTLPTSIPTMDAAQSRSTIVGIDEMTLDDLKLVRKAVDVELLRLVNMRSDSQKKREKASSLQMIRTYLAGYIERIERGQMKTDQVPIFPANARVFLKVFGSTDDVPELIDPSGNTPAKVRNAAAPTVAPSMGPLSPMLEEVKNGIFALIQDLRWQLAADYSVEENSHKRMVGRLGEMERRVMNYTVTDQPMPEGYEKMFLKEIDDMRDVLMANVARIG